MEENRKIVFLGYSQSGKTKILFQLVLHADVVTIPTIGFNVENVEIANENITIWDVGGKKEIIPLWKNYYHCIAVAGKFHPPSPLILPREGGGGGGC